MHTRTGGSTAVLALGSTGRGRIFSSSPSADKVEFERTRLADVVCVSALCKDANRDGTAPLCVFPPFPFISVSSLKLAPFPSSQTATIGSYTYCFGSMEHPDAKVPKAEPAVFPNTAESIAFFVALPGVKGYRRHP